MRIGELADTVGITPDTVRYYEKVGLLPPPRRTPSGYRDYPDRAPERLRFIRTAQSVGFSLGEIAEILALRDQGQTPCHHVRGLIRRHADELEQRIEDLRSMQRDLARLAEIAEAGPAADDRSTHCHILESAVSTINRTPGTD